MNQLPKVLHITYQGGNPDVPGEAKYAFFDSAKRCVFTALRWESGSSINHGEDIINAICDREGVDWREVIFYDLQTHLGYNHAPSGCYVFDRLAMADTPRYDCRRKTPGCGCLQAWRPAPCPEVVFQTFKDQIGTWPSIEEAISRKRSCYKDFTDKQLRDEREWAVRWLQERQETLAKLRRCNAATLLKPAGAKTRGYCLDPLAPRSGMFGPDVSNPPESAIFVDVEGSHYHWQLHTFMYAREAIDMIRGPEPFAIWRPSRSAA